MKLFDKWRGFIDSVKNLSYKDVKAWRTLIIVLVCLDLFGIYWYLGMKKLGGALLIVMIFGLVFLLLLTKDKQPPPETKTNGKPKPKEEEPEEESFNFDSLGLPNSENYNKRVNNALGEPLF